MDTRRGRADRGLFLLALLAGAGAAQAAEPASPPRGCDPCRPSELVELATLDPTIRLDIRYATPDNFAGRAVYTEARAFLQRPAAEALVAAHRWLKEKGYGIVVFDGYRPWSVTQLFWDLTPPGKRMFVADPATGSKHNRGCAVDVGLYELATGRSVEMPSGYDEMTERSFVTSTSGTPEQQAHRDLLREAMERDGLFFVYPEEWWHYDFKDFRDYPIEDVPFAAIPAGAAAASTEEPPPLLELAAGDYAIVGREPAGGKPYAGRARIERSGNRLEMQRNLEDGSTAALVGELELALGGESRVVRFRGLEPRPRTMTCLERVDLDNYLRLSCLWTWNSEPDPKQPGLETLFPTGAWPETTPVTGPGVP